MSSGALYVGAISGTSIDGLDLALLRISSDDIGFLAATTVPLPNTLRSALATLIRAEGSNEVERLGAADTALGRFIGERICSFLKECDAAPEHVRAVGSHGQTVRHRPDGAHPFTLQIGDPSQIAEITGITTVADFRRRDMAAGGQGAPLVPPFHEALFGDAEQTRAVVNIGGIANITTLAPGAPVRGHDTGPGNALMDAWCEHHTGATYDVDGRMAASGSADEALLSRLMADPYLDEPAPKSTGKEHYNLAWLQGQLDGIATTPENVQATLCEFTARSIAKDVPEAACEVVVCGGGRLNATLMKRLQNQVNVPVQSAEAHGVDGDAVEAAAFAWLAHQRLEKAAGNAPAVTGASGERVLGAVYLP